MPFRLATEFDLTLLFSAVNPFWSGRIFSRANYDKDTIMNLEEGSKIRVEYRYCYQHLSYEIYRKLFCFVGKLKRLVNVICRDSANNRCPANRWLDSMRSERGWMWCNDVVFPCQHEPLGAAPAVQAQCDQPLIPFELDAKHSFCHGSNVVLKILSYHLLRPWCNKIDKLAQNIWNEK